MKKLIILILISLLFLKSNAQPLQNNTNYQKITTLLGDCDILNKVEYLKNDNLVKEINYAFNGWQVLDSTLYYYDEDVLISKKKYIIEYNSNYFETTCYNYFPNNKLMTELTYSNNNKIVRNIMYCYKEDRLYEKIEVSNHYINDKLFEENRVVSYSSNKKYNGDWVGFSKFEFLNLYPYIDSVLKQKAYKYYINYDRMLIEAPCEMQLDTVTNILVQIFSFPYRYGDYYKDIKSPFLDSAKIYYKDYKMIYEILYFANGEIKELFYDYNYEGNLFKITNRWNNSSEKIISRRFEYENVNEIDKVLTNNSFDKILSMIEGITLNLHLLEDLQGFSQKVFHAINEYKKNINISNQPHLVDG